MITSLITLICCIIAVIALSIVFCARYLQYREARRQGIPFRQYVLRHGYHIR